MSKYRVRAEDENEQHLNTEIIEGWEEAVAFAQNSSTGKVFKIFEEEPFLFEKGDYVRLEKLPSGNWDMVRVPFMK